MSGVLEGLKGMRRVRKPSSWDAFALAVEQKNDEASLRLIRDLRALFGDGKAVEEMKALVLDDKEETAVRVRALEALLEVDAEGLRELYEKVILVKGLGSVAVRGLSRFDDPALGDFLLNSYGQLNPEERISVINALVTRPAWASLLLDRVEKGRVERTAINAFQARQIKTLGDERLTARLELVWGIIRDTAADKREQIEGWRKKLTRRSLAEADLPKGRLLYQALCAACHKLYGEGGALGPDLTGSGRANLDYLLENVIDPGGTVGADYRMSFLTLKDGRKLGGIVSQRGNGTVLLKQLTEETVVAREDIVKEDHSTASLMPEGLIQSLDPNQVRDLFAYLGHASQVPLPKGQ
jgi:putative heme-binding domain-containing protein